MNDRESNSVNRWRKSNDAHLWGAAAAPTRILVVDDEPNITDLVATALRYEGFDVTDGRHRHARRSPTARDVPART